MRHGVQSFSALIGSWWTKSIYATLPSRKVIFCIIREWRPWKNVLIQGLWERGTDFILDVWVMDTDATTCIRKDPRKVLEAAVWLEKKKYLQSCMDQRRHFTPFAVLVDGLIGK
jgi:hypothetical protein